MKALWKYKMLLVLCLNFKNLSSNVKSVRSTERNIKSQSTGEYFKGW